MLYSIGESASVISSLKKNHSKKDAINLLDIALCSLNGNTQADLDNIALKLQHLIPFTSFMGANVYLKKSESSSIKSNSRFDGVTFGIPTAFLNIYMKKKYHFIDPVIKESIQTFEFMDAQDLYSRDPGLHKNPIHQLALDFKLNYGFTYGVRSSDFMQATGFTFFL